MDFTDGEDRLDFSGFGFESFQELEKETAIHPYKNLILIRVSIDLDNNFAGGSIYLGGISYGDLDASDFIL